MVKAPNLFLSFAFDVWNGFVVDRQFSARPVKSADPLGGRGRALGMGGGVLVGMAVMESRGLMPFGARVWPVFGCDEGAKCQSAEAEWSVS